MSLPDQLLTTFDGVAEMTPLPGNENENYLVKTAEQSFVVKRLRAHSAENTEAEGVYRARLAEMGLPVSPYIQLGVGSYVRTIDQDSFVATPYVAGRMAMTNLKVVAEAGAFLAKVHALPAAGLPKRQSWYRKNYIADSLPMIDDTYADAKVGMTAQAAEYPDFWNSELPKGMIHGDLQEDNIIVDDQDSIVSLIDWEEAAIEPLLLDVAHSAQQLSFQKGVCNAELFNAFMAAYQTVRPLTDHEKRLFKPALRYTMLVLSVWAHIKKSRGEVDDVLFQRVGNYYKAQYTVPPVV